MTDFRRKRRKAGTKKEEKHRRGKGLRRNRVCKEKFSLSWIILNERQRKLCVVRVSNGVRTHEKGGGKTNVDKRERRICKATSCKEGGVCEERKRGRYDEMRKEEEVEEREGDEVTPGAVF